MKNVAVILAGGIGTRLGLTKPKQFLKIAGKLVIEHAVDAFEKHDKISEIAIVVPSNFIDFTEGLIIKNNWKKVKKVLNGGLERYQSSLSAICAYSHDANINLIFHDSARPLISSRIISDVCDALHLYQAVDVVIPSVDTIVQVDSKSMYIEGVPVRKTLGSGQTPQGFRLEVIKKAYEEALKDVNFATTDDCGVVIKYLPSTKIGIVKGERSNIKLTNPEDVYLLDKLFQIKSVEPSNNELSDLSGKVLVVYGGSSGIGYDISSIAKRYAAKVYVFSRSVGAIDIAQRSQVESSLKHVYQKEGRIDYVVNTAAILHRSPILNMNNDEVLSIIQTNYLGVVNTTVAAFPYLQQTKGQILQFTSSSYTRGRSFYALYSSTKAAVVNFVQAISEEWLDYGIRINCINPQRTNTPMRVQNFGIEDKNTLLSSESVAKVSLQTLLSNFSGEVVDIKLE